jgi:vacuolar-type H+-ATPase subunit E/Vma4
MEELRSTEVLDREILEDARKKAQKILKTADETLEAQTRTWDRKIKGSVDSLRKTYDDRIKRSTEEILAKIPLDKRRLRSGIAEELLVKAVDDFIRTLPREKLLLILNSELSGRLKALAGDETAKKGKGANKLICSDLSQTEASSILKSVQAALGSGDWEIKEEAHGGLFPSVVIDIQSQRITASVKGAVQALVLEKRAELAVALLGEGVLND